MQGSNSKIKNISIKLLLILGSCLLSLVLVETLLRLFAPYNFEVIRYLFLSKPALRDQRTAFGFHENIQIREVAVYWNGKKYKIEYDSTFSTNNLGLVQKSSFNRDKQSIVFIGDSFTQGEGATPWFYKFEERWQNDKYQLINLGIIGTGVDQWKYTLQWFSDYSDIKHIFICFISDDWERSRWIARENLKLDGLVFDNLIGHSQIDPNKQKPTFYFIKKDINNYEIFKRADIIRNVSWTEYQSVDKILNNFIILRIVKQAIYNYYRHDDLSYIEERINKNKAAFDQIVSIFGTNNITIIHIPQKEELLQGTYCNLGIKIKDFILSRNIHYIDGLASCGLTQKDFYECDSHPNDSGYEKLSDFISKTALSDLKLE